jgi:hypothetical protein
VASIAAGLLVACGGGAAPAAPPTAAVAAATSAPTAVAPTATAAARPSTATAEPAAPTAVPQATAGAAAAAVFSRPTEITNPFFPLCSIGQVIALGTEDGESTREEVTLLPETKTVTWAGGTTEVRVAQFVAYGDGKLVEVAYDYFAQADDGDVYYFGEDVANYEDGKVADHEGSWLAGKDGAPPALFMPAKPQIGMVFNPENLPGVVYETDEVLSTSEKAVTPGGPSSDGLLVKETLMDGSIEQKVYVAGFGLVEDRAGDENVHLVLWNAAGVAPRDIPGALQTIEAQAEDIFDNVPGGGWAHVQQDVAAVSRAWREYLGQATTDGAPQPFQDALAEALGRLERASSASAAADTLQAANHLSAAVVDLFDVYRPAAPADLGRLDVLERQVLLDVAAGDLEAAADSLAKIDAIWSRLKPSVLAHNGAKAAAEFETSLATQRTGTLAQDGAAISAEATQGLELVDALEQVF